MNRWVLLLRDAPASLLRLIARANRISLPRHCSAEERLTRIRAALCRQRTVRVTYFSLDPATRGAVQALRAHRGGIRADDLCARYGPLRSWDNLLSDPHPRTITERLVLLGWLVPRPSAHQQSPHFLMPPEVRAWLPHPLQVPTCGVAPTPPLAPVLRATAALIIASSAHPLPVRADGMLRRDSLRVLTAHLAPAPEQETSDLCRFLLPLLYDLGLLEIRTPGVCTPTIAAARFLATPQAEQRMRLQQTWTGTPDPDAWALPLLRERAAIAWPMLRLRLLTWAAALPLDDLVDPTTLHETLAAALGPLADAHTHPARQDPRLPWQSRRSARIFDAALRGPLRWLGIVAFTPTEHGERVARVTDNAQVVPNEFPNTLPTEQDAAAGTPQWGAESEEEAPASQSPTSWQYGAPGDILIPHTHVTAAVLRLLPFAHWQAADAITTTYRITRGTIARAISDGWSDAQLWSLLQRHAGPIPPAWRADLNEPASTLRLVQGTVILADDPTVLDRAARHRTVRQYLTDRLAPGVALAHPEHVPGLMRALERLDIATRERPGGGHPGNQGAGGGGRSRLRLPKAEPRTPPPDLRSSIHDLSAADCATLLMACAFYRQHAPDDAPHVPHTHLEGRLRDGLTPTLRDAVDAAIRDLRATVGDSPAGGGRRSGIGEQQQTLQPLSDPQPSTPDALPSFWSNVHAPPDPTPTEQDPPVRVTNGNGEAAEPATTYRIVAASRDEVHPRPPIYRAAPAPRPTPPPPPNALPPGCKIHVLFDAGISIITHPDGTVTVEPNLTPPDPSSGGEPAPVVPPSASARAAPNEVLPHTCSLPPETTKDPETAPRTFPIAPIAPHLSLVRRGIRHRHTIEMTYCDAHHDATTRIIRPLHLRLHGSIWYLEAYCALRGGERTFRLDRITALRIVGRRPRRGDPEGQRWQRVREQQGSAAPHPRVRPRRSPPSRKPRAAAPGRAPPGRPRVWIEA